MKIRRQTQSQDQIDKDDSRLIDTELGIERAVYRKLSSLTDNKVIQNPQGPDSEYERFLLHMNDIEDNIPVSESMDKFDEYLGTLGVTDEYPFLDDVYGVEPWIDVPTQDETRNVVDKETNIIHTVGTTTYNVVHRT